MRLHCVATMMQHFLLLHNQHLYCYSRNVSESIPGNTPSQQPKQNHSELEEIPASQSIRDVESLVGLFPLCDISHVPRIHTSLLNQQKQVIFSC